MLSRVFCGSGRPGCDQGSQPIIYMEPTGTPPHPLGRIIYSATTTKIEAIRNSSSLWTFGVSSSLLIATLTLKLLFQKTHLRSVPSQKPLYRRRRRRHCYNSHRSRTSVSLFLQVQLLITVFNRLDSITTENLDNQKLLKPPADKEPFQLLAQTEFVSKLHWILGIIR